MKIERFEAGRLQPVVLDNPAQAVSMRSPAPPPPAVPAWRAAIVAAVKSGSGKEIVPLQRKHGIANSVIAQLREALVDMDRLRGQIAHDAVLLSDGKENGKAIAAASAGIEGVQRALVEKQGELAGIQRAVTVAHERLLEHENAMRDFRARHAALLGREEEKLLGAANLPAPANDNPMLPALLCRLRKGGDVVDLQLEAGISDDQVEAFRRTLDEWAKMIGRREELAGDYTRAAAVPMDKLAAEVERLGAFLASRAAACNFMAMRHASLIGQRENRLSELRSLAAAYAEWPGLIVLEGIEIPPKPDYRIGRGGTM